jgi:hypothetical protein
LAFPTKGSSRLCIGSARLCVGSTVTG